jgi:DNA polymerase I-like protein with 3'-5' exonuclease and polymerase domains
MIYFVTKQKRLFDDSEIKIASLADCIDYFKGHSEIELDSETTGFDPHTCKTFCWQLGDFNNQFVVETASYSLKELEEVFKYKTIILQNAQFDLRFAYKAGVFFRDSKIYDTMLVEAVLTTGLGNQEDIKDITKDCGKKAVAKEFADRDLGLDDLGMKYLGITISKDLRGIIHKEGLSTRVIKYSAGDVKYLGKIKRLQLEAYEEFKLKYGATDALLNLENSVVKVFSRMLYNGIKVDSLAYSKNVIAVVNNEVSKASNKLIDIVKQNNITNITTVSAATKKIKPFEIVYGGDLFNPNACNINWDSPEQKLGVLKVFDPTLENSSKPELTKRIDKHPIFKEAINYTKFKKLKDSFGKSLIKEINPSTGRIHAQIWQILATGRISMSSPNLAQIPSKGELGKVIRSGFIPRSKEYVIIGGDYSGMELRIIAEFSKDPLWVKTFQEGGDLHSVLCSETFDIPIEDVKNPFYANPDITYRDVQKTINFGLAYGMSEYKLSSTILVSVDESRAIIAKFFSKVPKVKEFLDHLGDIARRRGYIKTAPPYSRVRRFPKWEYLQKNPSDQAKKWLGEIERAGKNTPIQGINGDILKLALINMQEEIDTNKWDVNILLSVYDEIQVEANRVQAESWLLKHEQIMRQAAETIIKTIPVVCECKISEHWEK